MISDPVSDMIFGSTPDPNFNLTSDPNSDLALNLISYSAFDKWILILTFNFPIILSSSSLELVKVIKMI